jgi:C4-dicarboxylate-specific signal transduction histidine kinase
VAPGDNTYGPILTQHLLLTVLEQVKLPLMNIARRAELAGLTMEPAGLETIRVTADAAVQLLDNYLLGVQLADKGSNIFETEPVSVAAVLHDAGNQLRPLAKAYGVRLDLQIDGRYGPVMAHRRGLQAALVSLGYALVEALPAQETPQLQLRLSAHRCRYGIVAGLYCEAGQVTAQALRLGRQLYGRARQPLNTLSHSSGAGVFVADAILHAMQTRLTVSHHRHMHGLGAVLPLNRQLQLV